MSTLPAASKSPGLVSNFASESRPLAKVKPPRLLACVLCQQRKVKCDHNYPCATCVKARVQCVQSTLAPRRRRRQFPERELLLHLRQCENLLTQHNIKFEPLQFNLHPTEDKNSPASARKASHNSDDEELGSCITAANGDALPDAISPSPKGEKVYKHRHMFRAMRQEVHNHENDSSSDDEIHPIVFKKAWDETIDNDDHLLLGWPAAVAMYTMHPQPVHVFQLWQIYLDNVNPLLKVSHAPSLQGRIIQAAKNVSDIKPELEALMFGIYCTAISSLSEDDCEAMFASPKSNLLAGYQYGCQQALLNSRFLRCTSRDCLTALYLYLVSIRPKTTPESLSSMLGVAIRIAQRMRIHSEADLAKSTPLEAEMSRRLWWSLILFDTRIGEMADFRVTSLLPVWDCRVPLNVNDSDLRHDMKEPPRVQGQSTDALFAVIRSELGDLVRRAKFHLNYYDPFLKPTDKDAHLDAGTEGKETDHFEKTIEAKYLNFCNPDNPLHFMTIWTTRGNIAKFRLMEHHARYAGSPLHQAETQREATLSYALSMLKSNTKLMTSPLTKGFIWMINSYFPFVGYIQAVQYLKWRPMCVQATVAWQVMSENYQANQALLSQGSRFFGLLASFILQAWNAREIAFSESESSLKTPQIVSTIKQRLASDAADDPGYQQPRDSGGLGSTDFLIHTTIRRDLDNTDNNMNVDDDYTSLGLELFPELPELSLQNNQTDYIDWPVINWDMENTSTNRTGATRSQEHQVQQN